MELLNTFLRPELGESELMLALKVLDRNSIEYAVKMPDTGAIVGDLSKFVVVPRPKIRQIVYDLIKDLEVGQVAQTTPGEEVKQSSCSSAINGLVKDELKGRAYRTIQMPDGSNCIVRLS